MCKLHAFKIHFCRKRGCKNTELARQYVPAHYQRLVGYRDHLNTSGTMKHMWQHSADMGPHVARSLAKSLLQRPRSRWQNNVNMYCRKLSSQETEEAQYFAQWLMLCAFSIIQMSCCQRVS